MKASPLAEKLLPWYRQHARRLPWRDHPDPYAVWVSEVMLQQTRVETVVPYYQRWMERFPTIRALARVSLQDVLSIWEGLGYYSRARNLHAAARQVVAEYDGRLPRDPRALQKLPGIGRYTAGAIASIAFGMDEPALDANVRRVLARLFNVEQPERSSAGEGRLWQLAQENLPPGQAGDFNQALMDLGSAICTPHNPDCPVCPLAELCQARALGLQEARPVRLPKPEKPHYLVTAAVIQKGDYVLIAQRPPEGLLGGLWEFPGGKTEPGETLEESLRREICEELAVDVEVGNPFGVFHHGYTHFRVTLHAFLCRLKNGAQAQPIQVHDLRWVSSTDLSNYPMGKIDRQIADRLTNL